LFGVGKDPDSPERRSNIRTISLENDEVVTAFEYYNFPDPGLMKGIIRWRMEFCAMSIFTITATETQKQYGPYAKKCKENATKRIYVEIPTGISFRDFLADFSIMTANGYVGMSSPPWTTTTTSATTSTNSTTTVVCLKSGLVCVRILSESPDFLEKFCF